MNLSPRFRIALLAAALVAPVSAQAAGDAFYLKGGSVQLSDDYQNINAQNRTFDSKSTDTYGLLFEHRTRRDIALGVEYLNYSHDFTPGGLSTPPIPPGKGTATTRTLQFVAKKYFGPDVFKPFFGLGVGLARTTVDYGPTVASNDEDFGIGMQAMAGLELRFEGMGLMFEAKRLVHDISTSNSAYKPSAIGFFAGIGFNW